MSYREGLDVASIEAALEWIGASEIDYHVSEWNHGNGARVLAGVILAALAHTAPAPALDVERLALAMKRAAVLVTDGVHSAGPLREWYDPAVIAREYAALAATEEGESDEM